MMAQTQNEQAKSEILASIRKHLAASAPFDAVRREHHGHQELIDTVIPRQLSGTLTDRFREGLELVGGKCNVVANIKEATAIVENIIREKDAKRIAVSDAPLISEIKNALKSGLEVLENASSAELFDCDIGITGSQWGIAETGTLVLESNDERHRLTSLVPPVHVAVIYAGCIRQKMSEILELVSHDGKEKQSRVVTFITGPSRTSDIELTLAIGVHGPGELHVIIIADTNL